MGLLTKIFGTRSEREIKKIQPTVDKILALEEEYKALTQQQLQGKTAEFKQRLAEGETLDAYALRALHERSVVTQERTYKRKWWPDVYPGDIARGSIASVRLDGDLRITRQALACGAGIEVTERASKEVSTWT